MSLNANQVKDTDFIVVGSGFTGSVIARLIAEELEKKVLIIERRNHFAGNMFDECDHAGVRVQRYGIHVIHTDDDEVIKYLQRFSELTPYKVFCLGVIEGKSVPIPFNFISIDLLFPADKAQRLKAALTKEFPERKQVPIIELLECDRPIIRKYAEYLYKHDFQPYTAKQWGIQPHELDPSVIARVPVELSENCDYFQRKYQFMPKNGFTALFEKMLDHKNIAICLDCDANKYFHLSEDRVEIKIRDETISKPIIYTGPLDEFFDYEYGRLPYRSLRFEYETLNMDYYQRAPFVAYPENADYTRIIEFKHFTGTAPQGKTTIMKEYPIAYQKNDTVEMEPYYPIPNDNNHILFQKYAEKAKRFTNLRTCGRLADYKYYYMFEAILRAFDVFNSIKKGEI